MKAYILTGKPSEVEKVIRENRIRIGRGDITFTPTEIHPLDDIVDAVLDDKEVKVGDSKDIPEADEKPEPIADSKEADVTDSKELKKAKK